MAMFELLSLKPEVSNALSAFIAMAPFTFNGNMNTPFKYFVSVPGLLKKLMYKNTQLVTQTPLQKKIVNTMCRSFNGIICKRLMNLFVGKSNQANGTRIAVYFNHLPSGTSTPNIVHLGQLHNSKKFMMFDYLTKAQNNECYGSPKHPRIPLEAINMKDMLLFNAFSDIVSDLKDVEMLKNSLKGN